jgi:hypothetical protein
MNLDESWINDFEQTDNLFCKFYKEDNYYIYIQYIYINKQNEIETMKKELLLTEKPNIISREEMISLLKKNSIYNHKTYTLLSLLKYNITLSPQEINLFLTKSESYYSDNFLQNVKTIDDIFFDKTINMYQDLNNLFIIFCEKTNVNSLKSTTKKIYLQKPHTRSK